MDYGAFLSENRGEIYPAEAQSTEKRYIGVLDFQ